MPTEARDIRYSGAEIRAHCEPLVMDAGNWTDPLLFLAELSLLYLVFVYSLAQIGLQVKAVHLLSVVHAPTP